MDQKIVECRPARPPLSPAMRALLETHHAETFEKGRLAGRREMEEEFTGSGLVMLGLGALSGAGMLWLIQRIFA